MSWDYGDEFGALGSEVGLESVRLMRVRVPKIYPELSLFHTLPPLSHVFKIDTSQHSKGKRRHEPEVRSSLSPGSLACRYRHIRNHHCPPLNAQHFRLAYADVDNRGAALFLF